MNNIANFMKCVSLSLLLVSLTGTLVFGQPSDEAKRDSRPNIVLILSDDAGYSDFSFRGSTEIKTPNLDRLSRQGVEFTQAYAPAPVCTPSRAGILTGRQPSTIGAEKNLRSKLYEHHLQCGLTTKYQTLAERLQAMDYSTALIGKWHLGYGGEFHPHRRGFDRFYGVLAGSREYTPMSAEKVALEENIPHRLQDDGDVVPENKITYLTDQLTDQAIDFMQQSKDKPFFLFLSYTAVHSPYQAKKRDMENYAHMKPPRRKIGAMVSNLDQNVGRVMDAIEKMGVQDNTLFIFTNDNGGTKEMSNAPYRGFKGSLFEGGIRVPLIARMPGKISAGTKYDSMVSLVDLYPTCLAATGSTESVDGDGKNLFEFLGSSKKPHDRLFFKFHSQVAVRKGDYKYYINPRKGIEFLFNVAEDPTESTNLVQRSPEIVAKLKLELDRWKDSLPEQDW